MASTVTASLPTRMLRVFILGIQLALGCWLGWAGATWASHATRKLDYVGVPFGSLWLPLLLVALTLFLGVLVHEGGHWLGSRYGQLQCFAVSVLWLHLERQGVRWHFRAGKRRAGALGYVSAMPFEFHDLRRRMAVFIAGGPAASLVVGGLALLLGWALRPHVALEAGASVGAYAVGEGFWVLGVFSIWVGVSNLLPFSTKRGNVSDGAQLLRLRQTGPEADRQYVLLRLFSASYQGVRPRCWDAALVAQLLEAPEESAHYCGANLYAYIHYLDAADIATARERLTLAFQARQATTPLVRRQIYVEGAYMDLLHNGKPHDVPDWIAAAARIRPFTQEEGCFVRALRACSCGEWEQARQALQLTLQQLDKTNDQGGRQLADDRIQALFALIETAQQPAAQSCADAA